jgi:hypothetical protein
MTDDNLNSKISLAQSSKASQEDLELLSKDENWRIREVVARNVNTPENTLEILSKDKFRGVRSAVAYNANSPIRLLELLAKDDTKVRSSVAYNTNCPIGLLELLAQDQHQDVRGSVAYNTNCPIGLLKVLAEDQHEFVRGGVAENANCPVELLEVLAKDKSDSVRSCVGGNPNSPIALLEILSKDHSSTVRHSVFEQGKISEVNINDSTKFELRFAQSAEAIDNSIWIETKELVVIIRYPESESNYLVEIFGIFHCDLLIGLCVIPEKFEKSKKDSLLDFEVIRDLAEKNSQINGLKIQKNSKQNREKFLYGDDGAGLLEVFGPVFATVEDSLSEVNDEFLTDSNLLKVHNASENISSDFLQANMMHGLYYLEGNSDDSPFSEVKDLFDDEIAFLLHEHYLESFFSCNKIIRKF